jgi:hypothetical protein
VQAVHDHRDGAGELVVEPAVEVWSYHSLAASRWICEGHSGFSGSSMTMMNSLAGVAGARAMSAD